MTASQLPAGEPIVRTLTMPSDANLNGGVFGGWILAEMDKAAGLLGMARSGGPCSTVAVEEVRFLAPLRIGFDFRVYGEVVRVGRTSMHLHLTGWSTDPARQNSIKVVEGMFVSVALDDQGRPRPVESASP